MTSRVVSNNKPVFIVRKGLEADVYLRKNISPLPDTNLFSAEEVMYTTYYTDTLYDEVVASFDSCYAYGEVVETVRGIESKIKLLQTELNNEDYKIIKCMEAQLCSETLPYDIDALHTKRQQIRIEINTLQEQLKNL